MIKGTGPAAKAGSTVTVQYVGVLYKNGKQFDASWDDGSGKPVSLPLTGVIPGWQQGIPGMKVGGRRELIIPASLGYGAAGSPPKIPPNSPLVFVIDLHAGLSSAFVAGPVVGLARPGPRGVGTAEETPLSR